MDVPKGRPGEVGAVEDLECQARSPELPGGQGQALKGLRRGVMGPELHFRKSNVEDQAEQWEARALSRITEEATMSVPMTAEGW